MDQKQNPDVCDVRKGVLKIIKNSGIKFIDLVFPKTMWYRYCGSILRIRNVTTGENVNVGVAGYVTRVVLFKL